MSARSTWPATPSRPTTRASSLLIDSHDGPVRRRGLEALRHRHRPPRAGADADRVGQRDPRLAGAEGRGRRRAGDPRPPRAARWQALHAAAERDGAGFAAALRRRRCSTPARPVPPVVAGPRGKAATRRYDVYRNNVTVSLIDALAAVYPGHAAHHRAGLLPRHGALPRARHAADLAAALRVRPRLSRLHRRLRACAGNALAAGRGADRARLARRLSRRRRRAAAAAARSRPSRPTAGRHRPDAASGDAHRALALSRRSASSRRTGASGPVGPIAARGARGRADHPARPRGRRPAACRPAAPRSSRGSPPAAARRRRPRRRSPRRPAFDLAASIAGLLEAGAFIAASRGSLTDGTWTATATGEAGMARPARRARERRRPGDRASRR